jgi:glycerol kinase
MQFQADMLDAQVVRPRITETTALGAAYAAGLATGYWGSIEDLKRNWGVEKTWLPQMSKSQRGDLYASWQKAVTRSLGWKE